MSAREELIAALRSGGVELTDHAERLVAALEDEIFEAVDAERERISSGEKWRSRVQQNAYVQGMEHAVRTARRTR